MGATSLGRRIAGAAGVRSAAIEGAIGAAVGRDGAVAVGASRVGGRMVAVAGATDRAGDRGGSSLASAEPSGRDRALAFVDGTGAGPSGVAGRAAFGAATSLGSADATIAGWAPGVGGATLIGLEGSSSVGAARSAGASERRAIAIGSAAVVPTRSGLTRPVVPITSTGSVAAARGVVAVATSVGSPGETAGGAAVGAGALGEIGGGEFRSRAMASGARSFLGRTSVGLGGASIGRSLAEGSATFARSPARSQTATDREGRPSGPRVSEASAGVPSESWTCTGTSSIGAERSSRRTTWTIGNVLP